MLSVYILFAILIFIGKFRDECKISYIAKMTTSQRKEIEKQALEIRELISKADNSKIEYSKLQQKCELDVNLVANQNRELNNDIGHLKSEVQVQKEKYRLISFESVALKTHHSKFTDDLKNSTKIIDELTEEVEVLTQLNMELDGKLTVIKANLDY